MTRGAQAIDNASVVAALNQDFGHRSTEETLLFGVASTVASINYLHRNLARYMGVGAPRKLK